MTNEQAKAQVLAAMLAVGEAISDLGSVPSGVLYAHLMGHISIHEYTSIIDKLIAAKLVKRDDSHMLTWIGPRKEA